MNTNPRVLAITQTTSPDGRGLIAATYTATGAFRAIDEHAAVAYADNGELIAVTGEAGDPASEAFAQLFAAAPHLAREVVRLRRYISANVPAAATSDILSSPDSIRAIVNAVENAGA